MPLVLEWKQIPGATYPSPLIQDDRDSYPPAVVRSITEWLDAERGKHETAPPTAQLIQPYRPARYMISPGVLAPTTTLSGFQEHSFESGTIEISLRKEGVTLARYHYLVARDVLNGKHILGPFLRLEEIGRI